MGGKRCNLVLVSELFETLENTIPGQFKNNRCQEKEPTCCHALRSNRLSVPMFYPSAIFHTSGRAVMNQSEGRMGKSVLETKQTIDTIPCCSLLSFRSCFLLEERLYWRIKNSICFLSTHIVVSVTWFSVWSFEWPCNVPPSIVICSLARTLFLRTTSWQEDKGQNLVYLWTWSL